MRGVDRVLDAYGLLAYFQGEAGEQTMIEVFQSAKSSGHALFLSTVNWGEVFYSTLRTFGRQRAEQIALTISRLPIDFVPADLELAQQAAVFKARGRISFADCFAAALAKLRNAELITGDKEFKQLEGEVKILWI